LEPTHQENHQEDLSKRFFEKKTKWNYSAFSIGEKTILNGAFQRNIKNNFHFLFQIRRQPHFQADNPMD